MAYLITKSLPIQGCTLSGTVSINTTYSFSNKPVPGLKAYKNISCESIKVSVSVSGGSYDISTTLPRIDYDQEVIDFTFTINMVYGGTSTPTFTKAELQISADLPDILKPYYYLPRNTGETPKSVSSVFEYERQASSSSTVTDLPNFQIPISPDKLWVPTFPSTVTSHTTATGGYLFGGRYSVISSFNNTNTNTYALKAGYTPYAQNNAHTVINWTVSNSKTAASTYPRLLRLIRTDTQLKLDEVKFAASIAGGRAAVINPNLPMDPVGTTQFTQYGFCTSLYSKSASQFPQGEVPHRIFIKLQGGGGGGAGGGIGGGGNSGACWAGIVNLDNSEVIYIQLGNVGKGGGSNVGGGAAEASVIGRGDKFENTSSSGIINGEYLAMITVEGGVARPGTAAPSTMASVSYVSTSQNTINPHYWTVKSEQGKAGGNGDNKKGADVSAVSVTYAPSSQGFTTNSVYSHDAFTGGSGNPNYGGGGGAASASGNGGEGGAGVGGSTAGVAGGIGAGGGGGGSGNKQAGNGGSSQVTIMY